MAKFKVGDIIIDHCNLYTKISKITGFKTMGGGKDNTYTLKVLFHNSSLGLDWMGINSTAEKRCARIEENGLEIIKILYDLK